ncbi:hypothetical protein GcM1_241043 [Golovinomyces cichoracearum]|uniref:Uncharacterized protein n=1 Tax=Golovinomyces cichoracearum TaxID=62708 RepID=A0A420IHI8_9PEZI|nr:hypothetical protein GcM1_241043 [Golovinomyces cichoracearum]
MRITCYAAIFSILYALVCGSRDIFMFGSKKPQIIMKKISNDVKCFKDIRIPEENMNKYGEYACLTGKANKQKNHADKKYNILNMSKVVYNYVGVNFPNPPDGSILLECHVSRPVLSIKNHWSVIAAWQKHTNTCKVLGAESTQRYGPPQLCAVANEPGKKHKLKQKISRPFRADRHKNQHF